MKSYWKFGMSSAVAAMVLAGCGDTAEETEVTEEEVEVTEEETEVTEEETEVVEEEAEPVEEEAAAEEVAYPLTVTDVTGEEVVIEEEPDAIVSLIPSNTEIAYALGEGENIVGVSDFANYPEEVADVEKVGGQEFNVEKIVSLQPDIVLGHESGLGLGTAGYQQLRDAGIPVYVVDDATNFEEVYASIEAIGQLTGETAAAEEIVAQMQEEVTAIAEQAAQVEEPKSVFVEVAGTPDIYTTGSNTFMHEMLEIINAENVAGDQEGWINVDPEQIVEWNPEVILTTYGAFVPDAVEQVMSREGFGTVPAVENEAVIDVNSDLVSRPGPRLTEGLQAIGEAVYPEIYSE
ncbi:ABC transporter substrate-binding protein [Planococcus lenghuensis]|uniref:ABC transporter substrate-binding protein n=1 Tax=Planococcus lenghuensis TaxID=2213202 RepID=A0A1Q2L2M4_9BACL|nr:ABC transporter substrate-binding protein [Planococcus lenghuensis]AQQ54317.1 ABC transporter substrate-binding protein [Planococcus lenghuensis]